MKINEFYDYDKHELKCYQYGKIKGLTWDEVKQHAIYDAAKLDKLADEGYDIPYRAYDMVERYVGKHDYDKGEIYDYRDMNYEIDWNRSNPRANNPPYKKVPTTEEYLRQNGIKVNLDENLNESSESDLFKNGRATSKDAIIIDELGLTDITIPDNVTSIWRSAFYGCDTLEKMIIPDSVTEIRKNAFGECPNLEELVFQGKSIKDIQAMDNYPWGLENPEQVIVPGIEASSSSAIGESLMKKWSKLYLKSI